MEPKETRFFEAQYRVKNDKPWRRWFNRFDTLAAAREFIRDIMKEEDQRFTRCGSIVVELPADNVEFEYRVVYKIVKSRQVWPEKGE